MVLANVERVVFATGVERKDQALSSLPLTQGLYDVVAMGPTGKAISFEQVEDLEQVGFELFKSWNDSRVEQ